MGDGDCCDEYPMICGVAKSPYCTPETNRTLDVC